MYINSCRALPTDCVVCFEYTIIWIGYAAVDIRLEPTPLQALPGSPQF